MSANKQSERLAVTASARAAPDEVLTLRLGAEEYGIDILSVQEIRSYEQPTRMAGAPPHVLGVTNLRGIIVPVVDLRCRFGLEPAYDNATVTVVLAVAGRTVGVVVDSVSDVVALTPAQIKPAPQFGSAVDAGHITGIATLGQAEHARMLILLDIAGLLTGHDLGLIDAVTAA